MTSELSLLLYAVYDHPKDYPDAYVCRRWHGMKPEDKLFLSAPTLLEIQRTLAQMGLRNIGRYPSDDSVIVEVWV